VEVLVLQSQKNCPNCQSENIYFDGSLWICPECANEWTEAEAKNSAEVSTEALMIRDSNGNILNDGDAVSVIKDLRVKGSSVVVKVGTKVRGIRLIYDAEDGHNIACKIDGIGPMNLKSEFVKKV
jgi:protein PhnA